MPFKLTINIINLLLFIFLNYTLVSNDPEG